MTVGNFTKQAIEQRISDDINTIMACMARLAMLNNRINSELAAGTLDGPGFYGANPATGAVADPNGKANVIGAYNEAETLYAWLIGNGSVAAPAGDPLAYAKAVIGF